MFDAGQIQWHHHVHSLVPRDFGFSERILEQHILWYITDGEIEMRVENQEAQLLASNSLIWICPGSKHSVRITDPAQSFTCYSFRFTCSQTFSRNILRTDAQSSAPFIEHLYQECCLAEQQDTQRCLALLYLLQTQHQNNDRHVGLTQQQQQTLMRYVQDNVALRLHPADLAHSLHLSPDYFSRIFKRCFNKSPKRWLMEQRIHIACHHLTHSHVSMREIADNCGYDDQNIFSRQFKQVVGCSPSQYRQRFN